MLNIVFVVDNIPEFDFGFWGEEWEGVGLHLTGADLMKAAEVLMGSSFLDGVHGEETGGCVQRYRVCFYCKSMFLGNG